MKPTDFREAVRLRGYDVWVAFAYSVTLSAIILVMNLYMMSQLKTPPTAWDPSWGVFICSLPMAFFFAAASHLQTRERIKTLEDRIRRLEGDKPPPLEPRAW
jgi:hypothetical protein